MTQERDSSTRDDLEQLRLLVSDLEMLFASASRAFLGEPDDSVGSTTSGKRAKDRGARDSVGDITLGALLSRLGDLSPPGDGFADDLEEIQLSQPRLEVPKWPSL